MKKRIKVFFSRKALANYQETSEFLLNASKIGETAQEDSIILCNKGSKRSLLLCWSVWPHVLSHYQVATYMWQHDRVNLGFKFAMVVTKTSTTIYTYISFLRYALVALYHHRWYFQSKMKSKFLITTKEWKTKQKQIIPIYHPPF